MNRVIGRLSVIVSAICGLSACATSQVKTGLPLELSNASGIELSVEADNSILQTDTLKQQVGKNLADWAYPIAPQIKLPASHTITILIGTPERGSTPTGFSFSLGNSDPRALDFQKADVVPITCRLTALNQLEQSAELNMGFSDSAVIGTNPNLNELADHASTVCFNLLKEVNWPINNNANDVKPSKNSWMPEIRIEQEQPASETPTKPAFDAPLGSSTTHLPETQENQEVESKPITKEINKEGRKVYIIHNQGNPVTFKFGHERK